MGTARIHRYKPTNEVVANNQKLPADCFTREMLSAEAIAAELSEIAHLLKPLNPDLHILVTVSPVRHLSEGLELNNLSKSILRYACYLLENEDSRFHYFPAYEIMMDELRDYRFYKEDMIHPTAQAEAFIWEKFSETFFSAETRKINRDWNAILEGIHHKPFREKSEAHQQFLKNLLEKMERINGPIDCSKELEIVRKRIES